MSKVGLGRGRDPLLLLLLASLGVGVATACGGRSERDDQSDEAADGGGSTLDGPVTGFNMGAAPGAGGGGTAGMVGVGAAPGAGGGGTAGIVGMGAGPSHGYAGEVIHPPSGVGGSVGRPFLVDGRETLACVASNGDWIDVHCRQPNLEGLSPGLRALLADHWRTAALMEHASIAAFARFALELMALGAPPKLVSDATDAMADEQRHATTCFALASAYAGEAIGPGSLDVAGCLAEVDLERITVTTFLEGCIGETLAAVEAREAARRVRDPALERALTQIAADESRHAALGWRFIQWALARGGKGLVTRLRAELALMIDAESESRSRDLPVTDNVALAYGVLPPVFRSLVRRSALSDIVAPCLEALAKDLSASASRQSAA